MKNNFKKIFLLAIIGLVVSCSDTEKEVDRLFDNTTRGAVLRTITSETSLQFRVGLPDVITITADVIDVEMGGLAEKVDVYLTFIDNNPDDGDNSFDETLIETIPASAFATGGKFPRMTVNVTAADILSQFGLTEDDYTGGDIFRIRLELTLTDGRVFTDSNTNSIIAGAFYRSPFLYTVNVTCPVPEDYFVGSYLMERTSVQEDPFFPAFGQAFTTAGQVVNITANGAERRFQFSYFPQPQGFQFPQRMTFTLICNDIFVFGTAVGGTLGCGGGATIGQSTPPVPSQYDLLDDNVIIIDILDFQGDGNCGTGNYPVTLRFTKQ